MSKAQPPDTHLLAVLVVRVADRAGHAAAAARRRAGARRGREQLRASGTAGHSGGKGGAGGSPDYKQRRAGHVPLPRRTARGAKYSFLTWEAAPLPAPAAAAGARLYSRGISGSTAGIAPSSHRKPSRRNSAATDSTASLIWGRTWKGGGEGVSGVYAGQRGMREGEGDARG